MKLYIENFGIIEEIKFICFIIVFLSLIYFIWIPYVKRIRNVIWISKAMLNMIPYNLIKKNEELKTAIISGNVIKAFR